MCADCAPAIQATLDAHRSQRGPAGLTTAAVSRELAGLHTECRAALRAAAEQLFSAEAWNEGLLTAVLETLTCLADPHAGELLLRAIADPRTGVKEDYTSMCDALGLASEADKALLAGVESGLADPERSDLGLIIRALAARRVRAAIPLLAPYLDHPSDDIRGVAVAFLRDFAGDAASRDAFARRLLVEQHPEIRGNMAAALAGWAC